MKTSAKTADKYTWGDDCVGWHLVNSPTLSVIEEIMPAGAKEVMHHHTKSQQFFYILNGTATFLINDTTIEVNQGEGIHIKVGMRHQIQNNTNTKLRILVISEPHAHGDRVL